MKCGLVLVVNSPSEGNLKTVNGPVRLFLVKGHAKDQTPEKYKK
jgi:hypothetical protein